MWLKLISNHIMKSVMIFNNLYMIRSKKKNENPGKKVKIIINNN